MGSVLQVKRMLFNLMSCLALGVLMACQIRTCPPVVKPLTMRAFVTFPRVKPEHGNVTKFILKYFSTTVCERKADSSPAFNVNSVSVLWPSPVICNSYNLHFPC